MTLDSKLLESLSDTKSGEIIYHEGKAHLEYDRDKKDLTGKAVDSDTEHRKYGTDGVSPIRSNSPADRFNNQVNEAKRKEDDNK